MSHYHWENKYLSSKVIAVLAATDYSSSLFPDLPKPLAKQGTVGSYMCLKKMANTSSDFQVVVRSLPTCRQEQKNQ